MQGRFGASMRGCASRMSHSFHQPSYSSKYSSRMGSNFSSKFQQNRSNTSYGIPTATATMTMTNPAFSCSSQTPNCMVYSAIGLTSTMQEGTHLVGFGSSSSVVSGMT